MYRRLMTVAAVIVFAALSAQAADPARSKVAELPLDDAPRFDLRALFDRTPGVIETGEEGVTVSAFTVEVVVARLDADGKVVKACVDSEEGARKFLTAPAGKLQMKERHDH